MTTRARALVTRRAGVVAVEEIEIRDPAPDEVLVRVEATGICHTDIAWSQGQLHPEFPVVTGHETSGVVAAVGAAVTRVREGDRVVAALTHHCGLCTYCEAGHPMLCAKRTVAHPRLSWRGEPLTQGFGVGGFATHVLVGESSCVHVPADVPLEVAALAGCAVATGVGAVLNIAGVTPGARVLVIGAGGIGLSIAMGAAAAGADEVVVVDPIASRRSLATELGATAAFAPGDPSLSALAGEGYDYVFESAGRVDTMEEALGAARRGGTITLVGAPPPDQSFRVRALDFVASQMRLLGCITGDVSPVTDFDRIFRLRRRGRMPIDALMTSRVGLEEAADILTAGTGPEDVRIMVHPQRG